MSGDDVDRCTFESWLDNRQLGAPSTTIRATFALSPFTPHPSLFHEVLMNPVQPITVAQYGIGPIGAEIARLLLTKPWLKIVAAVDVDPNKIGKDLGEVIGLDREVGIKVTAELTGKPDVVCHSTGSRLRDVSSQLKDLLNRGCHVVSTCEELSFPLD